MMTILQLRAVEDIRIGEEVTTRYGGLNIGQVDNNDNDNDDENNDNDDNNNNDNNDNNNNRLNFGQDNIPHQNMICLSICLIVRLKYLDSDVMTT